MHAFKGYSRHRNCHPRNLRHKGGSNGRRKKTEAEGNDAGHNDHALPSLLETFSWIMLAIATVSTFVVLETAILTVAALSFATQISFTILPFICIICGSAILDIIVLAFILFSFAGNELVMLHRQHDHGPQQCLSILGKFIEVFLFGIRPLYVAEYEINDNTFYEAGRLLIQRRGYNRISMRKFKAHFGATPAICADIWQMINPRELISTYAKPIHLLWGLMLIKVYATEEVLSGIAGVTEKTFRKWAWKFIDATSDLSFVLVS